MSTETEPHPPKLTFRSILSGGSTRRIGRISECSWRSGWWGTLFHSISMHGLSQQPAPRASVTTRCAGNCAGTLNWNGESCGHWSSLLRKTLTVSAGRFVVTSCWGLHEQLLSSNDFQCSESPTCKDPLVFPIWTSLQQIAETHETM